MRKLLCLWILAFSFSGQSMEPKHAEDEEVMWLYYEGLRTMTKGDYPAAIHWFRTFLEKAPKHIYADRDQYNLARAHFLNGNFGLAIVATTILEEHYPNSAMLGEAQELRVLASKSLESKKANP